MKRQIAIFLFLSFYFPLFSQSAEPILDKYLDTVSYKDPSKWLKIKSVCATSYGFFDAATFNSKIDLLNKSKLFYQKTYKVWPDQQKDELYSDSLFTDTTSQFYFLKEKHVVLINGIPPMETKVRKSVWFEFMPALILRCIDERKKIVLNGMKQLPGKDLETFEVVIETNEGNHYLYFNPHTYLLEGKYLYENNTYWLFSDYKDFQGYLIPTNNTFVKNGIVYSATTYTGFSFNTPIDKRMFIPPAVKPHR